MRLSRQHLRLAARSFSRNPGFSLVAVLSLALAIALNTTMYSVIDALVNPKLEVTDPDRLYWLTIWGDYRNRVDEPTRAALLRDGFNTYEGITLYTSPRGASRQVAVEHGRHYAQGSVAVVAPNFFSVLGARPTARPHIHRRGSQRREPTGRHHRRARRLAVPGSNRRSDRSSTSMEIQRR